MSRSTEAMLHMILVFFFETYVCNFTYINMQIITLQGYMHKQAHSLDQRFIIELILSQNLQKKVIP